MKYPSEAERKRRSAHLALCAVGAVVAIALLGGGYLACVAAGIAFAVADWPNSY